MNILWRKKTEPRVSDSRAFTISSTQEKIILHMKEYENMTNLGKRDNKGGQPQEYSDGRISQTQKIVALGL